MAVLPALVDRVVVAGEDELPDVPAAPATVVVREVEVAASDVEVALDEVGVAADEVCETEVDESVTEGEEGKVEVSTPAARVPIVATSSVQGLPEVQQNPDPFASTAQYSPASQ